MNALDHLRMASDLISGLGRPDRASVMEAAGHFWSATFDEEHWPLMLRVDSTSLKAKLMAYGTIPKTIQSLDAEHLALLAEELARFCFNATDELAPSNMVPELYATEPPETADSFHSEP